MEVLRMILPEHGSDRTGIVGVYDLRDPDQWEQARRDREQWGRSRSEIYALGTEHIAIVFKPASVLKDTA